MAIINFKHTKRKNFDFNIGWKTDNTFFGSNFIFLSKHLFMYLSLNPDAGTFYKGLF